MDTKTIALFGEAEKGSFHAPYECHSLPQLCDCLGNPPANSLGLYYAIQALLFHHNLIFFRVHEEGFSVSDYLKSLVALESHESYGQLAAVCAPGVGDAEITDPLIKLCLHSHSIFIISAADFYDYITNLFQ